MTAREWVLGVITCVTGDEHRRFTPADVQFGEDLARRAAVAIDNPQLHTELREVTVRL
jgi:GAF domain-containing protein